jgi:hypothetical protein
VLSRSPRRIAQTRLLLGAACWLVGWGAGGLGDLSPRATARGCAVRWPVTESERRGVVVAERGAAVLRVLSACDTPCVARLAACWLHAAQADGRTSILGGWRPAP